jgi:hypothetical protein
MNRKKVVEILKLIEFLNGEIKEVSTHVKRSGPRELTERLGALAQLKEKLLALPVDLPPEAEAKAVELYPALADRLKPKE